MSWDSLARVGAGLTQVQFHRWWSRNPLSLALLHASALQAEASCRNVQKQCSLARVVPETGAECAGVHTLQTSGCGCLHTLRQELQAGHTMHHWLQVSYVLKVGKTHWPWPCKASLAILRDCTKCRPSRGWRTRCGIAGGVRLLVHGSHSCGCLATRCGQGCGYFTLCQRFASEKRAAMVAGASRGALCGRFWAGARGNESMRTV